MVHSDHPTPTSQTNSTEPPTTTLLFPPTATNIQSAYRAHLIHTLANNIKAVDTESTRLRRQIQRQEAVDAVRTNNLERIKLNEALMDLLLTLDRSVPGYYDSTVRELRRRVSRRIVRFQEILDGICEAQVKDWDDAVEGMEEEVCRERWE